MFTGLVEAKGTLVGVQERAVGQGTNETVRRLDISTPFVADETPALGDSVAIDGVCLTVTARDAKTGQLSFEVAHESRQRTTLGSLGIGREVHLERALRFGSRLGGHLVSGHVDGVGEVVRAEQVGGSFVLEVRPPPAVLALSMAQGAITLAGVSLTLNEVNKTSFAVGLVPHTLERTTLGALRTGDIVNCEADLLARYVARLVPKARRSLLDALLGRS